MADQYMIIKSTQKKIEGVQAAGQDMVFGKKTHAFEVKDAGIAHDIEAQYGPRGTGDVVVIKHFVDRDPGHKRTFTVPELPWKRGQS